MSNNITLKIKYSVDYEEQKIILNLIRQYNSLLRFTYNRFIENPKLKTKEMTLLQKQMNNIDLMDQYYKTGATYDAKAILALSTEKVIFGGKKLFIDRCQNKISKEDFQIRKLRPLQIVGASYNKGNCKFQIITDSQILFKPNRNMHICLNLESVGKKNSKLLNKLIELQNKCEIAITYKLDINYVYITFDYNQCKQDIYKVIENRVLAIDLNPNYLGYSVIDWKGENIYKIIDKGVLSLKELNDKQFSLSVNSTNKKYIYLNNKRNYEVIQLAYYLTKLTKHFKCELFSIEDLSIKSKDLNKGKRLNRLVNNSWNRNKFINVLRKLLNCSSTKLLEVEPNYSSFIGNLVYRSEKLPDMVLSSIELSRRAYEFNLQYIKKSKIPQKNIIFPKLEMVKDKISKSLEELKIESRFETLQELYLELKKSKQQYRFLLDNVEKSRVFSKFYKRKYIKLYSFI